MNPVEPRTIDGIAVYGDFAPDLDYPVFGLEVLRKLEQKHFWFVARREIIRRTISSVFCREDNILEVGAGTGSTATELISHGYDVSVGDVYIEGLRYARSVGIEKCYQFDLYDAPFTDDFDGLLLFDVIEHLDNDKAALQQVYKMLRPGGKVVLTVPALQFFFSRTDVVSGHKRRYERSELEALLKSAGFKVQYSSYFFHSLLVPLWLSRVVSIGNAVKPATDEELKALSPTMPPGWINSTVLWLLRLDSLVGRFLPWFWGGSIIAVGSKNEQPDSR